jgi:hypothetical protein
MAYILTRVDKGTPLTYHEVDSNFTNLNDGKLERAAISGVTGTITSSATTSTITSVSVDTLAVGMVLVKTAGTGALGTASVISDVDPTNNTITVVGSTSHTAGSVTFTARPALSGGYIDGTPIGATSASTGAFTTIEASSDVTITGNLTVNGTTTNINTTNLVIEDKNVILGDVTTPSNTTADGGGITLKGLTDKTLNWVNSTSAWTSSEDFNLLTGKVYEINGTSVLSGSTLGSGVTASSLTSVGTLTSLAVTVASGTTVPLTVTNAGTGDTARFLDASGDTTMFRIDAAGLVGINVASTDTLVAPLQYGNFSSYTPAGGLAALTSSVNSYNQFIVQNSNSGSAASSDIVVNNNLSTDTTYYGDFGINSNGWAAAGAGISPLSVQNNVYLTATTGDLCLGTTTSNAIRFVIANDTTTGGSAYIDTSYNFGTRGNITAYYSDARLKNISGNIPNALNKVKQLNGVYYTNNDLAKSFGYTSDENQVGVIAQEVEQVLPEILKPAPFDVTADGTGSASGENYKTVQYDRLVPLLIEAIKELSAQVEELKNR